MLTHEILNCTNGHVFGAGNVTESAQGPRCACGAVVLKHPALVLPIGYLQLLAAQLPISMVPIVSVESLSWREIGKRFYLRGLDLGTLLGGEMFDPIALVRDVLPHFVDESEDESEDCDGVEIANISALELNAINAGYSEVQTYVMNPISSECVDNYAPTT